MKGHAHRSRYARGPLFLLTLLGLAVFALGTAATASAQTLPAICDEYPDLPVCADDTGGDPDDNGNPDDDGVGSDDGGAGPATPVGGDGAGGSGGGGELPFTGYPLTPLLLLLLLLLAIGLAIRGGLAIHDRMRRRAEAAALPPPA